MKYLVGVIFLMLANVASAVECQANEGTWRDAQNHTYRAQVDIYRSVDPADGGKIVMEDFYFACLNSTQPGQRVEIWTVFNPIRLAPRFNHFKSGVKVANNYYASPVYNIRTGQQETNEALVVEDKARPYLVVGSPPNGYIEIPAGAKIFTYNMWVEVWSGSSKLSSIQTAVDVYARNALNLNPSTCTINDNNPINIDFGSVDPLAIGGDISAGTPYRKSVALVYSCPDAGISSSIDIKLVGTASSFNTSALATTNPNLAAGLTRLSSLVAPGSSFRTSITNSAGSDTVLFTLFRKAGSVPAAGPFTASGTLVMSVP